MTLKFTMAARTPCHFHGIYRCRRPANFPDPIGLHAKLPPVTKQPLVPGDPETGCLYLVATPIGNLEDITVRALRLLGEVDLIACEDTRHTGKLLQHYGIRKPTTSYHEHNEIVRSAELVLRLEEGARVALVSDSGMPLISDPGYRLVSLC